LAQSLRCHYGAREVVRSVSLTAQAGTLTAILGPNGAGKSTLLRALAGLGQFEGEVKLCGDDLRALSRREIARRVALVPQDPVSDVPFTALELVLMGRSPHLGGLGLEGERDRQIAEEALRTVDALALAARPIDQLSGGERRRVFLARALAQQPKILLLDEPTAFLDLGHQAQVLEHARRLSSEGLCVLAVLHDPNLAVAWADQTLLLRDGQAAAQGPTREVLRAQVLRELYGAPVLEVTGKGGEGPFFAPFRGAGQT
jgi:iron complex transport system ATP-binding protein